MKGRLEHTTHFIRVTTPHTAAIGPRMGRLPQTLADSGVPRPAGDKRDQ